MTKLVDIATKIRSKNAGPYVLTFDVFFPTDEAFRVVRDSRCLRVEQVAALYRVPTEDVHIFELPDIRAMKITIPRRVPAGSRLDTDIYGAQAHVLLYDVQVT